MLQPEPEKGQSFETSRRGFLRAASAGVTSTVVCSLAAQAEQNRSPNERLGVGFIGVGGRAQAHIDIVNSLKQQGVAEPVAVCDVYRPRLEAAAKKCGGAKMYRAHEELLSDPNVDVVCIATPDRLHAPQAIDAVNAGKDVYCEKPLTHWAQFDLARKLEEAAQRTGRLVQVGTQYVADENYAQRCQDDQRGNHWQTGARAVGLLPPR